MKKEYLISITRSQCMSAPKVIKNQDYYNFTVSILIIVKRK